MFDSVCCVCDADFDNSLRVVQFLLQGNQISTDGALHLLSLCDLLTLRCKLIAY